MSSRGVGPVGQQRDPGWSRERLTFFIKEPRHAQKVPLADRLVSLACHLEGTPCAPLWRPSLGPRLHPLVHRSLPCRNVAAWPSPTVSLQTDPPGASGPDRRRLRVGAGGAGMEGVPTVSAGLTDFGTRS